MLNTMNNLKIFYANQNEIIKTKKMYMRTQKKYEKI